MKGIMFTTKEANLKKVNQINVTFVIVTKSYGTVYVYTVRIHL